MELHFISVVACLFLGVLVTARTVAVDDQLGDAETGQQVTYQGTWVQGAQCPACALQPEPSLAFDSTWHSSTYDGQGSEPSFTIVFDGAATAITVYFILDNGADPPYVTDLSFVIDGQPAETYTQAIPPSNEPLPGYIYNTSVFSQSNLVATTHSHTLSVSSFKGAMFDYAVYTVPDSSNEGEPPPRTTSEGTPIGAATSETGKSPTPIPGRVSSTSTSAPPSLSTATSASPSPSFSTGVNTTGSSRSLSTSTLSTSVTSDLSTSTSTSLPLVNVSPTQEISSPQPSSTGTPAQGAAVHSDPSHHRTDAAAIIGGSIGGVLVSASLVALLIIYRRRRKIARTRFTPRPYDVQSQTQASETPSKGTLFSLPAGSLTKESLLPAAPATRMSSVSSVRFRYKEDFEAETLPSSMQVAMRDSAGTTQLRDVQLRSRLLEWLQREVDRDATPDGSAVRDQLARVEVPPRREKGSLL